MYSGIDDKHSDNLIGNINSISLDLLLKVQKDVDPYDMTSLVFLLYKIPDTALQRLIVYQRVSKDIESNNMNMLYDWALNAQSRPTWRYEFLEALCICRLYNVIRKLGFNVSNVKKHYLPDNCQVNIHIDPMKKVLYKLCESMTTEYLSKLKRSLLSYNIDVSKHETCEAVLLELMCQKCIKLGQYNKERKTYNMTYDVYLLTKIIQNFSGLSYFATILEEVQNKINNQNSSVATKATLKNKGTPISKISLNDSKGPEEKQKENFDEIFLLLNQLHMEDVSIENLKSDTTQLQKDAYVIKNKNRLGICCIINQVYFYPSKNSIEGEENLYLEDRLDSTKDLHCLETTMSSLKFEVKSKSNLDHKQFIKFIRDVVQNDVRPDDSVFMLCILSHGVRGHVYAADSIKIKVADIQSILDSDDAKHLHGIPKVMILQACQVDVESEINNKIASDGPKSGYYLRKSHFLIYWATAPEYEAFRKLNEGSIFIQCLCFMMKKSKNDHLFDIFTQVTDKVTTYCTRRRLVQVPIFESTLRKKLFLHFSE